MRAEAKHMGVCETVIPGRCGASNPESLRFRVWSFGPSRNDGLSGRPDIGEKSVDLRTQHVGLAAQRAGSAQYLAGGRSGLGRGGGDADDVAGNFGGAA